MKNIILRSLSGILYVSLIIGTLLFNKIAFATLFLIFNGVALFEFYRFKKIGKSRHIIYIICGLLIYVFHLLSLTDVVQIKLLWLLIIVPLFASALVLFSNTDRPEQEIAFSLYGFIYVTLPLLLLNQLNFGSIETPSWLVMAVFCLIWINDTFAYLSGMAFGKHKLFERISPKKTWEGFAGGMLATLTGAWFFYPLVDFENKVTWLILGFLVSVSAVIGDFIESMFKRSAGVKDSGNSIPGHGGVLDRIDSLLFVFPVVFVYVQITQ